MPMNSVNWMLQEWDPYRELGKIDLEQIFNKKEVQAFIIALAKFSKPNVRHAKEDEFSSLLEDSSTKTMLQ